MACRTASRETSLCYLVTDVWWSFLIVRKAFIHMKRQKHQSSVFICLSDFRVCKSHEVTGYLAYGSTAKPRRCCCSSTDLYRCLEHSAVASFLSCLSPVCYSCGVWNVTLTKAKTKKFSSFLLRICSFIQNTTRFFLCGTWTCRVVGLLEQLSFHCLQEILGGMSGILEWH